MNSYQPSPTLMALLETASAAAVYEASGRQGELDPCIRALVEGSYCFGPAYTIKAQAHRSAGIAAAVGNAPAGVVIVVDVGTDDATCALGGTGALAAKMRGVRGCVTNGRVRDMKEIRELNFPVFAVGTTLRSGRKEDKAETGVEVAIGGQIVRPGDFVIADDDGVLIVPSQDLESLTERLAVRLEFERTADARVRDGASYIDAIAGRPDLKRPS